MAKTIKIVVHPEFHDMMAIVVDSGAPRAAGTEQGVVGRYLTKLEFPVDGNVPLLGVCEGKPDLILAGAWDTPLAFTITEALALVDRLTSKPGA